MKLLIAVALLVLVLLTRPASAQDKVTLGSGVDCEGSESTPTPAPTAGEISYILPWVTDNQAQNMRTLVAFTAGASGASVLLTLRDRNGFFAASFPYTLKGYQTKTFYPVDMLNSPEAKFLGLPASLQGVFLGSVTITATAPVYPVACLYKFTDDKIVWAEFQQFHLIGAPK